MNKRKRSVLQKRPRSNPNEAGPREYKFKSVYYMLVGAGLWSAILIAAKTYRYRDTIPRRVP